jgi:hypothetical protein
MMQSSVQCKICSGEEEIRGFSACHCGECHETFGSVSGFDRHRVGSFGAPEDGVWSGAARECRIPAGYAKDRRGYWVIPREVV